MVKYFTPLIYKKDGRAYKLSYWDDELEGESLNNNMSIFDHHFMSIGNTVHSASVSSFAKVAFLKKAIQTNSTLYSRNGSGYLENEGRKELVAELFSKFGNPNYDREKTLLFIDPKENFALDIGWQYGNEYSWEVIGWDEQFVKDTHSFISSKISKRQIVQKGHVNSVLQTPDGLSITKIGCAGEDLIRENYADDIMHSYDYVVSQLRSKTPAGKVVIFDGPPGTGKTRLLRGMFNELNATFVVLPPSMVQSLDGPSLLKVLLREVDEEELSVFNPVVLVLEDADHCLVPRASDNMSSISTILNLGDGILGEVLNLRIVATTNAKSDDIDPAILRPGRLLKRVEIGKHRYDFANKIFKRITGTDQNLPRRRGAGMGFGNRADNEEFTLAEIYESANRLNDKL